MNDLYRVYNEIVEAAISGRMVAPGDETSFEVVGPMGLRSIPNRTVLRDGFNPMVSAVEGLMMVAGEFDVNILKKASEEIDEEEYPKQGDYGRRLITQMPKVIQLLRDDKWTRRAVAYFNSAAHWQTEQAAPISSIHWMIRNDTLETVINVTEWNLCYGLPYDLMSFGILTQVVARCLNVLPGDIHYSASAPYLCPEELASTIAVKDLEFNLGPAWCEPGDYWESFQRRAHHALIEFNTYGSMSPGVLRMEEV